MGSRGVDEELTCQRRSTLTPVSTTRCGTSGNPRSIRDSTPTTGVVGQRLNQQCEVVVGTEQLAEFSQQHLLGTEHVGGETRQQSRVIPAVLHRPPPTVHRLHVCRIGNGDGFTECPPASSTVTVGGGHTVGDRVEPVGQRPGSDLGDMVATARSFLVRFRTSWTAALLPVANTSANESSAAATSSVTTRHTASLTGSPTSKRYAIPPVWPAQPPNTSDGT